MLRRIACIAWILIVPPSILGVCALNKMPLLLAAFLALLAGLSLPALFWFHDYKGMCWVRQDGVEFGPMSIQKLGRMHKTGNISDTAMVRNRWAEDWKPFAVLTEAAPRLSHGLVGAALGFALGIAGGFALFGQVATPLNTTLTIQPEWVLDKPQWGSAPPWAGAIREAANLASKSGHLGLMVGGQVFQAVDRLNQDIAAAIYRAIDNIRLCGLAGAVLLGGLFASRAEERYRLLFGQRVADQRRQPRPAKSEATADQIFFRCSQCSKRLTVATRLSGQMVNCPACSSSQHVPLQID